MYNTNTNPCILLIVRYCEFVLVFYHVPLSTYYVSVLTTSKIETIRSQASGLQPLVSRSYSCKYIYICIIQAS